ncbi:PREDICTED: KIF1-binding protein homolog [Ceratosolen solmsi marchali]|uniref:KIF-binding protein n=1 Tax=Ceratosolen solmsi marchali TaxID=326594 RepID=A0AAJ6YF53_9HYME|nr:PREDICTED: KIF1-binding protein homolog [Ceratosolen solmsi marchali]
MENYQTIIEVIKAELKEKYIIVRKLIDEDSLNDLITEPYKSKYAAMEILKNMQTVLLNFIDNMKPQEDEMTSMLACVYLNLGIVAIETEELKAGQDYLTNCIGILNKMEIKSNTILFMINALNQLGILWSKQDQATKAKEYLECAEKEFKDYKCLKGCNFNIYSMFNIFGIKDCKDSSPIEAIEKHHTLTLYYLAQIYGSLNYFIKSAIYCHMTLNRQLEMNDFDSIDWALNAATLSQFFMEKGGFRQAKHHLAAATCILEKYESTLKNMSLKTPTEDIEILESKWENFKHRSADINRCWAKYGILLMSMSRERLIFINENGEEKYIPKSTKIRPDDKSEISQECLDSLNFKIIENDLKPIADKITDKYLLDFNDAKGVFLNVQKWLDNAQKYFTLENQASDHVQIIQDMSQLYKYLAFFEENDARQAKMHKRRVDLLENIVNQLNEKYYKSICQQIWIELGETYSEILDIKLDHLKIINERPTLHMITRINNLIKSAIKNFTKFLNSLNEFSQNKFSEDILRPALCAYFHLGRLYNKCITSNKQLQFDNAKKSLDAYTFVVNYCKNDLKAAELMSVELNICKDFVKFLPIKMNKLVHEITKE